MNCLSTCFTGSSWVQAITIIAGYCCVKGGDFSSNDLMPRAAACPIRWDNNLPSQYPPGSSPWSFSVFHHSIHSAQVPEFLLISNGYLNICVSLTYEQISSLNNVSVTSLKLFQHRWRKTSTNSNTSGTTSIKAQLKSFSGASIVSAGKSISPTD